MSVRAINVILGAIMVIAVVISFAAARDYSRPNFEFLPDMVHGPSYQAFESNPHTVDGKTLRLPAPGSIARGLMPFHYERTEQDALRAGTGLTNPIPIDDDDAQLRGGVAYAVFCQPCHGATGAGDGMVAKRGFPPPPSLLIEHARNMKDGQLFHIITLGQGNMPGHAAQVAREDRWKIINYIRTMQAATPKQPVDPQQPVETEPT